MELRRAMPSEYEAVRQFYHALIDDMADLPYHPRWQKGIYPADDYLQSSIERGELHLAISDGIVGAMIVNREPNEAYAAIHWPTDTDKALIIHALGTAVSQMRHGVGKALVREAVRLARADGQRVIRLDVLEGNEPARRLYLGAGFRFVERTTMFYEDTGWCGFELYEYEVQGD